MISYTDRLSAILTQLRLSYTSGLNASLTPDDCMFLLGELARNRAVNQFVEAKKSAKKTKQPSNVNVNWDQLMNKIADGAIKMFTK